MNVEDLDLSAVFRDDGGMAVERPLLVWDGFERAPQLLRRLVESEPALDPIAARLRHELPIQRIWGFGASGAYVRPDRHVRAIYLQLAKIPGAVTAGGCLAIKGSEAAAENFPAMVERLRGLWNLCSASVGSPAKSVFMDGSMLSALERFPVIEGKPPGVHPVGDAIEEAEWAMELQAAHLGRYRSLARAPVPLFVYRWPDAVGERVLAHLAPELSPKAARIVEAEVRAGLGTYVYYYPCLPLRVLHMQVPDVVNGATYAARMAALREITDPARAIEGWLELTARMLSLGYVATDPSNLSRGYCLHAQNLVIDGGMVDVNSLRAMSTFRSDGELQFAVMRTIQVLAQEAVSYFLVGSDARVAGFLQWTPDVFAHVWSDLRRRLQAELDAGHELHPMLARWCRSEGVIADLTRYFEQMFDLQSYRPGERESERYSVR
jgi:hypothetical protein